MEERNNGKKKFGFVKKEQQSASEIGKTEQQEAAAGKSSRAKRPKKKRIGLRILGAFGTLCLVGVLSLSLFVGIFMTYVDTVLRGHVEVDLSE